MIIAFPAIETDQTNGCRMLQGFLRRGIGILRLPVAFDQVGGPIL